MCVRVMKELALNELKFMLSQTFNKCLSVHYARWQAFDWLS